MLELNLYLQMENQEALDFWAIRIGMSHTALNYRLKTYGEDNLISFKQKLN